MNKSIRRIMSLLESYEENDLLFDRCAYLEKSPLVIVDESI
jgi:hypothetical protein